MSSLKKVDSAALVYGFTALTVLIGLMIWVLYGIVSWIIVVTSVFVLAYYMAFRQPIMVIVSGATLYLQILALVGARVFGRHNAPTPELVAFTVVAVLPALAALIAVVQRDRIKHWWKQ